MSRRKGYVAQFFCIPRDRLHASMRIKDWFTVKYFPDNEEPERLQLCEPQYPYLPDSVSYSSLCVNALKGVEEGRMSTTRIISSLVGTVTASTVTIRLLFL